MAGLVGAVETLDRRYIDFVDGSIMTDGAFSTVSGQVRLKKSDMFCTETAAMYKHIGSNNMLIVAKLEGYH
jgi:hypothetical protein